MSVEGTTPPIEAATLDSSDAQGGLEPRVEKTRPEPAEVLHACKTQVAELELWLQQANVAFEPETLNADMQQVVEQQLVGCQAMLTEIEHKVAFLLETCKDQGLGDNGATQHEAEALSLKLKTVKCNLEKVQMMLQEKHSEDQVLELKPMEQKDFIKFIEFNAKKMWPQYCQRDKDTAQESSASNQASSPENDVPDSILSPQGQNGDKWQYLHHELSSKIKLPLPQLVELQVSLHLHGVNSLFVFENPTSIH
uniref:Spectrin repeat containing nuclear envelope protein 2 n=1 Tax=Macaca fascicularis TaxID=9541 RepID=A0A7N9CUX2_MACFA